MRGESKPKMCHDIGSRKKARLDLFRGAVVCWLGSRMPSIWGKRARSSSAEQHPI